MKRIKLDIFEEHDKRDNKRYGKSYIRLILNLARSEVGKKRTISRRVMAKMRKRVNKRRGQKFY